MAFTYPVAPVGSIYQVTYRMTWLAQKLVNTFHFRLESNGTGQLVNQVCDEINLTMAAAGGWYAKHKAARDSTCVLDQVDIQQIATLRYVPLTYVKNQIGDIVVLANVPLTAHLSANIERKAVVATRRGVGGIRFPIPGDNTIYANGVLTAGYKLKLLDIANLMQSDLNLPSGNILKPVIYHRGVTPNFDYVGAAFYQDTVRAMARRVVGRGI